MKLILILLAVCSFFSQANATDKAGKAEKKEIERKPSSATYNLGGALLDSVIISGGYAFALKIDAKTTCYYVGGENTTVSVPVCKTDGKLVVPNTTQTN